MNYLISWKLYLFLDHQYQPVSFFLLTAVILVYPYLGLKMPYGEIDFH